MRVVARNAAVFINGSVGDSHFRSHRVFQGIMTNQTIRVRAHTLVSGDIRVRTRTVLRLMADVTAFGFDRAVHGFSFEQVPVALGGRARGSRGPGGRRANEEYEAK